ncbi:IclR family transcriptional regulator C-terminal domain-containing protein [Kribbella sancticallisti]|uniref:IclR family transcriptional regulator C-terminal domain-containing protein n=1 Tax=Kribbella sancticallisti TaxID=460087 RepID=A0ABP4QT65_9ACTN
MTLPTVEPDPRYHLEAAARTIELLQAVGNDSPVTIAGLSARLGWTKPMVYRLVRTLHSCGALKVGDDGYSLGPMMISLGYAALQSVRLVEAARPLLNRIHEQTNESVVLTVLDGTDIVYVDFLETDHLLVFRARLGTRLPASHTSSGHALLRSHTHEELATLYAGYEFEPPTVHAVSSLDVLERRLEAVRRKGYALVDQEVARGHRSAAGSIFDHTGRVVAAVSISVPAARVSLPQLRRMAEAVLLPAVAELNAELGYVPGQDASL